MIGRPSSVSPSFACAAPFSPLGHHYKLWLYLFLALPWIATGIRSVRVHSVVVPDPGISGEDIQLECRWSAGTLGFYSIRWYKDLEQFYSYIPQNTPEKVDHNLPGVNVMLVNSNESVVTLRRIDLSTEGTYRCEVMSEAPIFHIDYAAANLTVVELPREPYITAMQKSYREGDTLRANCTVMNSRPAAEISFQVNGMTLNTPWVRQLPPVTNGDDGGSSLTTTTAELSLPLSEGRSPGVEVTCLAKVYKLSIQASSYAEVLPHRTTFSFFNAGVPSVSPPTVVLTLLSAAVAHLLNT